VEHIRARQETRSAVSLPCSCQTMKLARPSEIGLPRRCNAADQPSGCDCGFGGDNRAGSNQVGRKAVAGALAESFAAER
jgi:hypothetical protein